MVNIEQANRTVCKAMVLICFGWMSQSVLGYRVMASLNTYKKSVIPDAVEQVQRLGSDGVWFITQNMDFSDSEYQTIFKTLGGLQVSEDNPNENKSYADYVRIMGTEPADSMCYNETGGDPGKTLLTDEQIDLMYTSHGNRPILCLTRSYGGEWRTQTDRCLANPKVDGIVMEYVKNALLENINAPAQCIEAVRGAGKRCYLLLHAGQSDGWTEAENAQIIRNLNTWAHEAMKSDEIILVYQNYHGGRSDWLAETESVMSAIKQACSMPNYTGKCKTPEKTAM